MDVREATREYQTNMFYSFSRLWACDRRPLLRASRWETGPDSTMIDVSQESHDRSGWTN